MMRKLLPPGVWATAGAAVRRGGLDLLDRRRPARPIREDARDLVRQGREFVDDVEELALHPLHRERHAEEDQARDERRADGAPDVPALEPAHDGTQRVGDENAEQQRHEEILGPLQAEDERDGGDHAERETARLDMNGQPQVAVRSAELFARRCAIGVDEAGFTRRLFDIRGRRGNRRDWVGCLGCCGAGLGELHDTCLKKNSRSRASAGSLLPGRMPRGAAIETTVGPARARAARSAYFTRMSFLTDDTPFTPRATSAAFCASCGWATKPDSCTSPL
jgi:hypothetical protein